MKQSLRDGWLLVVAALLLSACVTGRFPTQAHLSPADDLDSSIDTLVNDKSTWVDPADPF